ncbi:hypothetical protein jhhlp_004251 [Lomentospora prolificans]|uniref:Methyltransferase domain-containing protein n=1 Tax=Lomentospora prolificans TaxID=41688 RepID=A0A2N3NB74_9PEZI|nr:hypothetical protein jhhlp_004251 [Lomentospora prolificans]
MSIETDAQFWDSHAKSYAQKPVSDEAGYRRTLDRTSEYLKPTDSILELGCGSGSTALRLASAVQTYLATDISPTMIQIANDKNTVSPIPGLSFRVASAETIAAEDARFKAVLGFNYLHLVRDLPETLRSVHSLLDNGGLFISKTACIGQMNFLIRLALPAMKALTLAPSVLSFREPELVKQIKAAGFEILENELHASKGNDCRPFIVARKV